MIHLYGLARAPVAADLSGIHGAPVATLEVGDLRAVVSHHDAAVPADAVTALAHVAVIEAIAEHAEVLPVRYGPGHADAAALRAELDRARPRLHTLLDRVGRHVEFVVRAARVPAPVTTGAGRGPGEHTAPLSGRAYLEDRRAAVRAATEAVEALHDRIVDCTRPLVTAAAATEDTTGRTGPERCFLVPREAAARFAEQAQQLTEASDLVVGGPWPPFTFASLSLDPQAHR